MVKNIDHDGTRTHNLPIRSRTPYPLGHAAATLHHHKTIKILKPWIQAVKIEAKLKTRSQEEDKLEELIRMFLASEFEASNRSHEGWTEDEKP